MLKIISKLSASVLLGLFSISAFAVVDVSPVYCENATSDDLDVCGISAWPAIAEASWLENDWVLSYSASENIKKIKNSENGIVYADIRGAFVKDKPMSIPEVANSIKKRYLSAYPQGRWNSYSFPALSKEGTAYRVFKFVTKDASDASVDVVALIEAPVILADDKVSSVMKEAKKAVYILGMAQVTNEEFELNRGKFKEFLQSFSIHTPTESADKKVIEAVEKLREDLRSGPNCQKSGSPTL